MRVPLTLLAAGLAVMACAREPQLPPALPEPPVLLEPLLQPVSTTAVISLHETPSAIPDLYQHLRTAKRRPAMMVSLPPQQAPERPTGKPLPLETLVRRSNQAAQVVPTEQGYFGGKAIYRFGYIPGKIYVIPTNPSTFTKLYFPPGEKKATLPTLNEDLWKTLDATMGPPERTQYVLGVRPMEDHLRADMALEMESGRSYFLRFVPSTEPMLAVTWELPTMAPPFATEAQPTAHPSDTPGMRQPLLMPVDLASLHTGYQIELKGKPSFVPTQVYDDATRTIVKMKALTGNAPVVFTYKADGSRGLVQFAPYVVPGDQTRATYYIVENVWPKIELAGTDGASVIITRLSEGLTVAQPWTRP
jgi:type IV secretory pathway VirB9-like protein